MPRDPSSGGFDDAATQLQRQVEAADAPLRGFALVAVEGPAAGQRFELDGTSPSRVLVGQSPACDLRLPDRQASRRHAALEVSGRYLKITDLGSTNGTFVDGVRIGEAYLRAGELIRIGASALRVDDAPVSPDARVSHADRFGALIGSSLEMRRLYPLCERLAQATVPVVIEGETGTGKEVLAESLHAEGPRAAGPYVVFDCTAVPPNLVESELFGHERGAFTGAVGQRKGVFEQAHGGTLLIDEIGDLEASLQPKLLRVLERSEVRRVGGDQSTRVDVRVLAATRRDLDREVQLGRFRDDLFHRLAVARVELPPLRSRRGDVSVLARHFAQQLGGGALSLPSDLLARWEEAPWPGNVRELRNAVARQLTLGDLLPEIGQGSSADAAGAPRGASDLMTRLLENPAPLAAAKHQLVDEFERRYIQRMLELHDGNVAHAAAASGLARRYFQILRARKARG